MLRTVVIFKSINCDYQHDILSFLIKCKLTPPIAPRVLTRMGFANRTIIYYTETNYFLLRYHFGHTLMGININRVELFLPK